MTMLSEKKQWLHKRLLYYGWQGMAKEALNRLTGRWLTWRTVLLFERKAHAGSASRLTILQIDGKTRGAWRAWVRDLHPEAEERFARGDRCYAVLAERNTPAAFGWAGTGRPWVSETEQHLVLPARTPWIYDCHTFPAFRGRGLYPQLLNAICRDLAQRHGARRVLVGCLRENHASWRGIRKAGFHRCGSMTLLGILGWKYRRTSLRPRKKL